MKDLFHPKSSEVVTQPFVDHLCSAFSLDPFGDHGIEHWFRVLYNGRLIADAIQGNVKVIELFALLHDCQRQSEYDDPEHGLRGAQYAETIRNVWFDVTDAEMWQLTEALSSHSSGSTFHHPTVQACWDADRLDLARVGIRPESVSLCHAFSKRLDVIDAAVQRSALMSDLNVERAAE
jgi:uncharacterized protein